MTEEEAEKHCDGMSYTKEELLAAVTKTTARQMAEVLASQITLASEVCPDVLRNALSKVFSVEAYDQSIKELHADMKENWQEAMDTRTTIQIMKEEITELRQQLDSLQFDMEVYGE